jgi:hypothetical protein
VDHIIERDKFPYILLDDNFNLKSFKDIITVEISRISNSTWTTGNNHLMIV